MTHHDTQLLTELFEAKRTCLRQMANFSARQSELVESDDLPELLGVLGHKQRLLAELQEIERRLDPFRSQDPAARRWRSPEDRLACSALISECEALLAELVRQEHDGEQRLTRRRDSAAARLTHMQSATRARAAYASPGAASSGQLDLTSES